MAKDAQLHLSAKYEKITFLFSGFLCENPSIFTQALAKIIYFGIILLFCYHLNTTASHNGLEMGKKDYL